MPFTPQLLLDWAALLLIASPITYRFLMTLTQVETQQAAFLDDHPPVQTPSEPRDPVTNPQNVPQITHSYPHDPQESPPQPGQLYTKKQLAEAAGVSVPPFTRNWLPRLLDVAPKEALAVGRKWNQLAMDMVISQRHARTEGMDGATWVDAVAWPRWGELNEVTIAEVVSEAEENAAIVPAELVEATSEAAIILQDAKQLRQQGQGVMDAIITGIAMEYEQTDELGEMTDEQLIALDEMQRIAKEQQIRAKVRAEFNAKQAQVKANNLQQRSDQLKGKGA